MKYGNFVGICFGFHLGYKVVVVGDLVCAQFVVSQVLLGMQLVFIDIGFECVVFLYVVDIWCVDYYGKEGCNGNGNGNGYGGYSMLIECIFNMHTVDIDLPTFAMHSIRKLANNHDINHLMKILTTFYSNPELP